MQFLKLFVITLQMVFKYSVLYLPAIRTGFDLVVEFQYVRMPIRFLESGDFVLELFLSLWCFDCHVDSCIGFGVLFPLSFENFAVSALTEKTPSFTPADFKDFSYGLKVTVRLICHNELTCTYIVNC